MIIRIIIKIIILSNKRHARVCVIAPPPTPPPPPPPRSSSVGRGRGQGTGRFLNFWNEIAAEDDPSSPGDSLSFKMAKSVSSSSFSYTTHARALHQKKTNKQRNNRPLPPDTNKRHKTNKPTNKTSQNHAPKKKKEKKKDAPTQERRASILSLSLSFTLVLFLSLGQL